jgi:hypothetical protein
MKIILITGTLGANDIPENVAVVMNGNKTEMAETKRGTWALTSDRNGNGSQWTFHLIFILDFPAIAIDHGRKKNDQYLARLLTTGDMSDITFVVKGVTFNAHKIIVSASPVLAAMFQGKNFKEGQSNSVEIDDIDSKVFEQLLHYLYTGRAPLWEEDSITEPLFMAADKYQMDGLKEACANILIRKLALENVVHFLIVGHLYSAPKLEEASFKCLVEHRGQIWDRPEWRGTMTTYPDLFYKVNSRITRMFL